MVLGKSALSIIGLCLAGTALGQINKTPAARVHVREEVGQNIRYTSKLATVIELNFTFGFHHNEGKPSIAAVLNRLKTDYALDGKDAFVLRRFVGPNNGTANGLPNPAFTLADLNAAEVYVTNNISSFNNLNSQSSTMGSALQTAVRGGKAIVGFHGSGDGGSGWNFYTSELHPVNYAGHGSRTPAPIYKNEAESSHVVIQGILATGTRKDVPMSVENGREILKNVITRDMTNEWYRFGRNLLADPTYGPLTTCLLKYDYRAVSEADLQAQYRYPGGNPFLWMIKINQGRAAYLPSGHDANETTQGNTSFDAGTGDFGRVFAQMLFYLAGYNKEPCTGSICNGLPIVNARDHLTGRTAGTVSISFEPGFAFRSISGKPYSATLTDVSGRVVASRSGSGYEPVEFDRSRLRPGIYFLSVKVENEPAALRRLVVSPSG